MAAFVAPGTFGTGTVGGLNGTVSGRRDLSLRSRLRGGRRSRLSGGFIGSGVRDSNPFEGYLGIAVKIDKVREAATVTIDRVKVYPWQES